MNAVAVSSIVASGRVEIANTRRQALTMAKWRLVWVAAGFAAIAVIAVLRVLYLGLVEGSPANAAAYGMTPPRGDIVDRNGVPLARAFPAYALWYNPAALGDDGAPLVRSPNEVAIALNRIFPEMGTELERFIISHVFPVPSVSEVFRVSVPAVSPFGAVRSRLSR